jgi:hypothetical protein
LSAGGNSFAPCDAHLGEHFQRELRTDLEKTKPEIGRESVRPEAPDLGWLADLAEAIYRAMGGGGSSSVTITPLPPDWQNGDPLPPSTVPADSEKPEYRCPGGWSGDECTA